MAMTIEITERTRIRREAHRQVVDRVELFAILDEALVGHVAFVRDGRPVVLPFGIARDGESLLIHGSTGGGVFLNAQDGVEVAVEVTHLDGLVFARSVFNSSMNYRSAVVFGVARPVPAHEKEAALRAVSEQLMPGRWDELRATRKRELAATLVMRVPIDEASVKIRRGGPSEEDDRAEGEDLTVWAGVVPLRVSAHAAVPSMLTGDGASIPASVAAAVRR
jgi:nitroimidazol reductase NimA-like FMN-containing flavoprotein (pyridoxamine 5'-phosphate oxidase superfamily)